MSTTDEAEFLEHVIAAIHSEMPKDKDAAKRHRIYRLIMQGAATDDSRAFENCRGLDPAFDDLMFGGEDGDQDA